MTTDTPFRKVLKDINKGCLCACHTGLGAATSCNHCKRTV